MTSDTGIDTFATIEPEFMTFFAFGIVGAGVIQVILVWWLEGYEGWFVLLWVEDFLDLTGFLFFGKFGVGINLADFLSGFFVHIWGVCFVWGVIQVYFSILFMFCFICYW